MNSSLHNRLGALALGLHDAQDSRVLAATGLNAARAAALVSIGINLGIGATALAPILGLTQSVAARLGDELAQKGWLDKRPGRTGRDVGLHLTPAGEALRTQVLAIRAAVVAQLLDALSPDEQSRLGTLIDPLLAALATDRRGTDHLCRLCDEQSCTQPGPCPLECALQSRTI